MTLLRPFGIYTWLLTEDDANKVKEWVALAVGSVPKEPSKRSSASLASSSGDPVRKKKPASDADAAAAFVDSLFE